VKEVRVQSAKSLNFSDYLWAQKMEARHRIADLKRLGIVEGEWMELEGKNKRE
jgi:hypothetical protein